MAKAHSIHIGDRVSYEIVVQNPLIERMMLGFEGIIVSLQEGTFEVVLDTRLTLNGKTFNPSNCVPKEICRYICTPPVEELLLHSDERVRQLGKK